MRAGEQRIIKDCKCSITKFPFADFFTQISFTKNEKTAVPARHSGKFTAEEIGLEVKFQAKFQYPR